MESFVRFWRQFKRKKLAYYSLFVFLCLFVVSMFADFIVNDKPIFIYKDSKAYFPIFYDYPESAFGGEFTSGIDYKDPRFKELTRDSIVIMPLIPYSYATIDYEIDSPPPTSPSARHILGTDDRGRDLFARLVYGYRISLLFGIILSVLSSAIGVCIGAISGYYGGKVDIFLQRFVEIWASIPILFVIIIISSFLAPSFWRILFIVLLFSWISLVSFVRAEFLRTRNFDYVKASKALGVSDIAIIFKHILPNALISATTYLPFIMAGSITTLTSLDFLGFGISNTSASLGEILNQGKENINTPHIGIIGFLALSLLLSLLIFIGDGIRDTLSNNRARAPQER